MAGHPRNARSVAQNCRGAQRLRRARRQTDPHHFGAAIRQPRPGRHRNALRSTPAIPSRSFVPYHKYNCALRISVRFAPAGWSSSCRPQNGGGIRQLLSPRRAAKTLPPSRGGAWWSPACCRVRRWGAVVADGATHADGGPPARGQPWAPAPGDIGPQGVQSVGLTGITGLGGLPGRPRPRAVASRPMPSGYSLDRAR